MKSRWVIFFLFLLLQNFNLDTFVAGYKQHHDSNIAHILAAGLIIQMLSHQQHHKHHHHGHHHGHESRHNAEIPHHSPPHHHQESRMPQPQYPMPAYPVQPLPWNVYGYAQQAQDAYAYAQYAHAQNPYNYAQQSQVPDPGIQHAQAAHHQHQLPILPQSSPYVNSHGELKQHVIQ